MKTIRFEAEGHRYFEDELELPSLTAVLELGGVAEDLSRMPPDVLRKVERKQQIGTAVHRAIHLHLTNDLDWDSLDPQVYWYVVAALRYLETEDRAILAIETPVGGSDIGYACTPDLRVVGGLLEWKCTYEIRREVRIQLAGQANAWGDRSLARRVVQLKPDGSFDKKDYSSEEDFSILDAAVTIARWKWNGGNRRRRARKVRSGQD